MIISIKYLGKITDTLGKHQEIMEFDMPQKVAEFNVFLTDKYPLLKKETFKIAVNQVLVEADFEINESCEVAILPPFAGG